MAIGISIAIVVYMMVIHEFSFDQNHKDRNRIYRVVSLFGKQPDIRYISGVPMPLGKAAHVQVAGLQETVRFFTLNNDLKITIPLKRQMLVFRNQSNAIYAGPEYFKMFNYHWLAGTPQASLGNPYQVVLTKKSASQYFPGMTPAAIIGQKFVLKDSIFTIVSGIVDDPKAKTDLNFRIFVSIATAETERLRHTLYSNWSVTVPFSQLYVKLAEGTSVKKVEQQLGALYRQHNPGQKWDMVNYSPYQLQPLTELHFDARFGTYYGGRQGHKPTLYGLILIASFLLILGCINFINLSTAQASQRAKEIGIRQTLGGSRKFLFTQFLSEALVLTMFAILVALSIVPLILRVYGDFIPPEISFYSFMRPSILFLLLTLFVIVGALSGFYPAWILSGYKPAKILKKNNHISSNNSSLWIRKGLILFQFIISQVFIIGTVLVGMQLRYTLNKDLGFRNDAVIFFETDNMDTLGVKKDVLYNKLKAIPEITGISLSNGPPAFAGIWSGRVKYSGSRDEIVTEVHQKYADTNFLSLFEILLLTGRNIRDKSSPVECVINEVYSGYLGFTTPDQAIGKMLDFDEKSIQIVGVMANFHQESLHTSIKPLMLMSDPENERNFNIGLNRDPGRSGVGEWKNSIAKIQKVFEEIYPDKDFEYEFQDEEIARYYTTEKKLSFLLKSVTALTIFISCLGLFGLTVYSTNRRRKEISIRKVMGATVMQIVRLFTLEFISIIVLAFIIAVPVTYWFVHQWLNNFSYRISMSWWIFGLSGLISVVIVMITISSQAIRAAFVNPAEVLKSE